MLRVALSSVAGACRAGTSIVAVRHAAVGGKVVPAKEDKSFVESDAEKLAKYVCINHYVQVHSALDVGGQIIFGSLSDQRPYSPTHREEPGPPIKPDSEYPEWLFQLDLSPPKQLEDLDPEKDGWAYWRALRKRQIEQSRRIAKLKTRFLHLQDSPSMRKFSKW